MKSQLKNGLVLLLSFALIVGLNIIFLSYSGNPPNGKTGAPGEGTCADCHNANGGGYAGMIEVSGLPSDIEAGQLYNLTVTSSYTNGSPVRTGFQMTGLDGSNNTAGSLLNNSANTVITNSGGRVYLEHNPAQNYNGSGSVSWTVDWTAPSGPDGENITFYAASVIANGAGGNSGDDVVTTSTSGTLSVVTEPLQAEIIFQEDITCNGFEDGRAEVEVSGGVEPYDFLWSNGETANPAVNLGPGMHSVTVSDAQQNTANASVDIIEPPLLLIDNSVVNDNFCPESEDGSIEVFVSGGTPPYQFNWSNGESTSALEFLGEGMYSVTVSDANDCIVEEEFQLISIFPSPEVEIVGPQEFCEGEIIELSTFESYVSYVWSTGETNPSIFVDFPGLYEVTVVDDNGCTGTALIDVFSLDPPVAEIEVLAMEICMGQGTVSLGATVGELFYSWSTGDDSQNIVVTEEGLYSLTVTDDNNCESESIFELEFPDDLQANIEETGSILCYGENTGYALVSASGGMEPYAFSLFDPTTGQNLNFMVGDPVEDLSAGNYWFIVEDAIECRDSIEIEITQASQLFANLVISDESAQGANDGTATVVPSGGTPPYQLANWSNGSSGNTIENLAPGTYSVTLSDDNGCQITEDFIIQAGGCDLSADAEISNVSCFGEANGEILITTNGGTPPFNYSWSNGDTTGPLLQNLPAGVYEVSISDSFMQCSIIISDLVLNQPDSISIDLILSHESQKGANDGMAEIDVSGGVAPYSIFWSTGDTLMQIDSLMPGVYSVSLSDANNCSQELNFEILEGEAVDEDMDGYSVDEDCDDNDPDINPGADEIANNDIDENCDGEILVIDEDEDGFNSDEDCNDNDPDINPDADEIPDNGIDEDCDGEDSTTSTSDAEISEFRIYPNPARDYFRLEGSEISSKELSLFNIAGKGVKLVRIDNEWDVSELETGVYMLHLKDEENKTVIVKRLLILKD